MDIEILYGVENNYVNITDKVKQHFIVNSKVEIPKDDNLRAFLFGDHIYGTVKHIFIIDHQKSIYFSNVDVCHPTVLPNSPIDSPHVKLAMIRKKLESTDINNSSAQYQKYMALATYLIPSFQVLVINQDINYSVISSLLNSSSQMLILESKPQKNTEFNIQPFNPVIKVKKLFKKFKIRPDVLITDTQLYFIIKNNQTFLSNFNMIITKLRYDNFEEEEYVVNYLSKDHILVNNSEYQVWSKK